MSGDVYVEFPQKKWEERLAIEYSLMQENEPTFDIVDDKLYHYMGVIIGSGLYEDGYFKVEIILPRSFPYDPPEVIWHTRIWHPNFSDEVPAKVCDQIFKDKWSPSLHVITVIGALRSLLNEPNPDDPLNMQAAIEMKNNPEIFKARVREYIVKYARPEQAFDERKLFNIF